MLGQGKTGTARKFKQENLFRLEPSSREGMVDTNENIKNPKKGNREHLNKLQYIAGRVGRTR